MLTSDFYYELPDELIAQQPLPERISSRLLILDKSGSLFDRQFKDLLSHLDPGDCLVFNDTEVMAARFYGHKSSGGRVEILLERLLSESRALAHVRASKSPAAGSLLQVADETVEVLGREDDLYVLELQSSDWTALMQQAGHMPLPPYIKRDDQDFDQQRYQTVYAKQPGAVAAPTAGLHFDEEYLRRIDAAGIERVTVTLHVGAGTFQPIRVAHIKDHKMHHEHVIVDAAACEQIRACKSRGNRVIAVGTTAVRSLETASSSGELVPFQGETDLFITPGYHFNVVDAMITNFHLPESTLLMLVSAFAGFDAVMSAYRHAIEARYRFFSYGDAMLIERPEQIEFN